MKMVKNGLPENYTVAWFDAWKYDKEENALAHLLLTVLSACAQRQRKTAIQPKIWIAWKRCCIKRIDIEKAGGVTIDLFEARRKCCQRRGADRIIVHSGGAVLSEFIKALQDKGAEALTDDVTQAIQRERTKIHIEQVRL